MTSAPQPAAQRVEDEARAETVAPRVILVGAGDHSVIREAVGHILSRGRVSLVTGPEVAPGADEILRRAGSYAFAPAGVLRAAPALSPTRWPAPTYRVTYPTPGRSSWRKKTRRANSHGQRRS